VLLLWSEIDFPADSESPLTIWKKWADDVTGTGLPCGHFLMEELPHEVVQQFMKFYEVCINKK
jgi:haloacetate dehalogenase